MALVTIIAATTNATVTNNNMRLMYPPNVATTHAGSPHRTNIGNNYQATWVGLTNRISLLTNRILLSSGKIHANPASVVRTGTPRRIPRPQSKASTSSGHVPLDGLSRLVRPIKRLARQDIDDVIQVLRDGEKVPVEALGLGKLPPQFRGLDLAQIAADVLAAVFGLA
jgi:hypothetical protein